MGLLTPAHLREIRRYVPRLIDRKRLVACPVCEARAKDPCTHNGRPRTWVHWQRGHLAAHKGFVEGLRLHCKRPGECSYGLVGQ